MMMMVVVVMILKKDSMVVSNHFTQDTTAEIYCISCRFCTAI